MTIVTGNELTFLTYDYLKVNKTDIKLPDVYKQDFNLRSDKKVEIKEFEGLSYGTSKEAIEINDKMGNVYKYYETAKEETRDFGVIRLYADDENTTLLDSHDIVANADSSLKIILDYSSTGDTDKFRNSIIRIVGRERSNVQVFVIQRDSEKTIACESIAVYAEAEANVEVYQYELGAKNLYTNYQSYIMGDKANVKVDSIYFGYGDHELDLLYNIFHYGKETTSDIMVNGVLKDNCRKVFKSNLDFKDGSTQAEGSEEEYVTHLDDTVFNISVPILLCHEDDVRGNHAASAGKIDPEILFYIMSRGFEEEEAKTLIIESKFSPTIDALGNEAIEDEIWRAIYCIIKKGWNQC